MGKIKHWLRIIRENSAIISLIVIVIACVMTILNTYYYFSLPSQPLPTIEFCVDCEVQEERIFYDPI